MNSIKYILILMLIWFVISARTCLEDEDTSAKREETYILDLRDSIKHVFMSDSLSDQLLRAYEITASDKLDDFTDYLKIISDTTLDKRFREHAAELVRYLFVSDEIELRGWSSTCKETGLKSLKLLISHGLAEGVSWWSVPIQIIVSKSFVRENDSTFLGNLSFTNNCIQGRNKNASDSLSERMIIDVYLIRKLRSFGDEQLRVWEVYLGDMN